MDMQVTLSIFITIFIAELPDKSALASLLLATRYSPLIVLIGAMAALGIHSVLSVAAGSLLFFLPQVVVHRISGALFLIFALLAWRRSQRPDVEVGGEVKESQSQLVVIWSTFAIIFAAEWGDLTQLAIATFAAKYQQPLTVFVASTLALWLVALVAVLLGNQAGKLLNQQLLQKIAAVAFAIIGVLLIADLL